MRVLGLKTDVRPSAALAGLAMGALAYALLPGGPRRLLGSALGVALWYEAELNHTLGHVVSARLAGAPIDRLRWGLMLATLYDNNDVTPRQHIGRAMGGPLASALAMLCWWLLWRLSSDRPVGRLALIALAFNTLLTLVSWLPLPWVDGGVILRNIRKL
jgi:hypothetical protein